MIFRMSDWLAAKIELDFQVDIDEESLSPEEQKDRKIMKLLLKIKNGTPPMRKAALRQITDKAREMGAGPLFNQILPLLMSPTLEDQERHLLVKVSHPPPGDVCLVDPFSLPSSRCNGCL